jgi:hypothetical protein
MDGNSPTPKQASKKYWGNLGYFRKSHYLRQRRGWCFAIAALCSIAFAATYHFWGSSRIFSKGPISQNHASLPNDCRACHIDAEIDPLKALRSSGSSLRSILTAGSSRASGKPGHWPAELSRMDKTCLECHRNYALHGPQSAALALRSVSNEMALVHATQCFICHREHAGHEPMAAPIRETCISCHSKAEELSRARTTLPLKDKDNDTSVAATGENRDLGDGLIRFLAPARISDPVKPFADYAGHPHPGHPPFNYEQANLKDPADLEFNHWRHEQSNVTALEPDKTLDCIKCHKPSPGGVYYQPVKYEQHCKRCHSLQILPSLSELRIPHGDAQKVRFFLASIEFAIENFAIENARANGTTDSKQLSEQAKTERQDFGLGTLTALENDVFSGGDRNDNPNLRRLRDRDTKFIIGCKKCHPNTTRDPDGVPQVPPPNMAERWVQRGPFTHLPHTHMDCVDCHQDAHTSKLTSDILMPPQKLCAECHRSSSTPSPVPVAVPKSPPATINEKLTADQRRVGDIKWDCQSCHVFHAPPDAGAFIRATSSAQPGSTPIPAKPSAGNVPNRN